MDDKDLQRVQDSIRDSQRELASRIGDLSGEFRAITRDMPDKYIPRRDLDDRFRDLRDEQRRARTELESMITRVVADALRPISQDIDAAHESIRDIRERSQFLQRAAITALISGLVMMAYTIITQLILRHA